MTSQQPSRGARGQAWSRWAFAIASAAGCFLVSARFASELALAPLAAYVVGFACVVSATLAAGLNAPRPAKANWLVVVAALLGLLLVRAFGGPGVGASLCVLVLLLCFGSVAGAAVGGAIEEPGHLLFVALVSSLADTFSVTQPEGPSAALVSSPEALSLLALSWPMLGTSQIAPLLGVGDVLFASLYLAAARAHALPGRRTVLALGLGFLVTMLTVIVTELPIPALPFLGAAMLLVHPAARLPPARDRRKAFAMVFLMALALALLFLRRRS